MLPLLPALLDLGQCLSLLSVINTMIKSNLRRVRLISSYGLQSTMKEVMAGAKAEGMDEWGLPTCFPWLAQTCFLLQLQTACPGVVLSTVG